MTRDKALLDLSGFRKVKMVSLRVNSTNPCDPEPDLPRHGHQKAYYERAGKRPKIHETMKAEGLA